MNENDSKIQAVVEDAAAAPQTPPPHPGGEWRPYVLAAIAILIALGSWLYGYRQNLTQNEELAKRISEFDTRSNEARVLSGQAQESMKELLGKIGLLEQKLAESQNQQLALEALYQELARSRDEAIAAEIEQLLISANHQLQLSGNIKAALIALETAESRLQRLDRPQLITLRKAINKDIDRLRAAPLLDIAGLSIKLDAVIDLIDTLPLIPGAPLAERKPAQNKPQSAVWWRRFVQEAWDDFAKVIRVQNTEQDALPLLPPEQAYFTRENLRLRLLSARLALLTRDEKNYRADLKAAQAWLKRYYDQDDKAVHAAQTNLQQLATSQIQVTLPDISASLMALRNLKPASERGGR